MKKLIIVSLLCTAFLAACGGGGGGSGTGAAAMPTYTESEVTNDLANFNSKEKAMESGGLKIKKSFDYNNGLSSTHFTWDKDFANDFSNRNSSMSDNDFRKGAIVVLQDYIAAGEGLIKKYDQPFNLKKDSGEVQQQKMLDDVKAEIKAKMDLAHQTMDKMNQ